MIRDYTGRISGGNEQSNTIYRIIFLFFCLLYLQILLFNSLHEIIKIHCFIKKGRNCTFR